jgi:hypothetical protein
MNAMMCLQLLLLTECLTTYIAVKGPLPTMYALMILPTTQITE